MQIDLKVEWSTKVELLTKKQKYDLLEVFEFLTIY